MDESGTDATADLHDTTLALGRLLHKDAPLSAAWTKDDLADLFRHQLQTHLKDEAIDPQVLRDCPAALEIDAPIENLLLDPDMPVTVLISLKAYARWLGEQDVANYPRDCATALYYCAIGAAWLHTGEHITSLPEADLQAGLTWTASQAWIPEHVREMLINAGGREA